jgi:hypothetical protein
VRRMTSNVDRYWKQYLDSIAVDANRPP